MMQVLTWIFGIYVCLFLSSCVEPNKERLSRLVKEWEGKEILFPPHSIFTIQGEDTVDFHPHRTDYKIVSYIDSLGCTHCKLQLSRWMELVAEVDSLTDGSVPFFFYFHSKDMKELRMLTKRDGFTYPVCFDEKDEFNRLNRFPSKMAFQTFLLDKNNNVIALGNPILNPKIKELYVKLIVGNQETRQTEVITQVSVNQMDLDFGRFPKEEKQERSFMLTNTGKEMMVIYDVVTSCGCAKVEYSREPVRPGGTLEVKVIYEADNVGRFNKTIKVYCNADNSPFCLQVKGISL